MLFRSNVMPTVAVPSPLSRSHSWLAAYLRLDGLSMKGSCAGLLAAMLWSEPPLSFCLRHSVVQDPVGPVTTCFLRRSVSEWPRFLSRESIPWQSFCLRVFGAIHLRRPRVCGRGDLSHHVCSTVWYCAQPRWRCQIGPAARHFGLSNAETSEDCGLSE